MMRAAYIEEHGGLERLQVGELPQPEAGDGEVVVAVKAAALNHLDIWLRKGRPGLNFRFPHILGSDAAGVVARVGEGVTTVSVGQEVVLNPGISCMKCAWCLRGEHSACPEFGIVGAVRPGSFAEFVAVPALNVYPRPTHLTWEESAALPLAHLTAWHMLFTRGQFKPGETVLIHGIGGGVALALLQLCKAAGGRAVVTSSSRDKLAAAQGLGADHGIVNTEEDVAAQVLAYTNGEGVDLCLDSSGAATWPVNFAAVRKAGRIVHCGITTGARAEVNLPDLYWRQLSVLGSTMGSHVEFRALLRFVSATGLRPVLDKRFPLEAARAAQERMEEGKQFGKLTLHV